MALFSAKIANFIAFGDSTTTLDDGSIYRNIIELSFGDYSCKVKVLPDVLKPRFAKNKGSFIESGVIEIEGVETLEEGERVVTDICWLLTFITASSVVYYECEFGNMSKSISVSGFYNHFRPVIEYQRTYAIKNFIQSTWDAYQHIKESRKLPAIIHYLLECDRPNQLLEVQFLFTAIILESLKSTYANSKGYEYDGSGFTKEQVNKPKCEDGQKCIRRYFSFKELLTEMFAEMGMSPDLKNIINLRNEVFHNGLSKKGYEYLTEVYDSAQDVIREYLLKLLAYKGEYLNYSTACRQLSKIT